MSLENANLFLESAAQDAKLRAKFETATNPEEFIKVASESGYEFTTEELKEAVTELSKGVILRRKTGVWPWLRTVKWV